GRPDAVRRDALDRRFVEVDESDIRLVVNLEVSTFQRHAARAKAMISGDQLLGDSRILDALAYLAREIIGHQLVGQAIQQDIAEIAYPDAEARLAIELFPERLPFRFRDLEHRARVRGMDEAAHGFLAAREDV